MTRSGSDAVRPRSGFANTILLFLCGALGVTLQARAAEFLSVSANGTVFYDAPSAKAKKLFLVGALYPVEVVVTLGEWVKVRDLAGGLAWVPRAQLSDKRTVVVTAARADIRQTADESAAVVFQAEQGVALEYLESGAGWVKVRHRDGQSGYLKLNQVWGA